MPTASTLRIVDAIAADATRIGRSRFNDGLRTQAALVRGLVDELTHHHPAETRVVNLHAQLVEELKRMVESVADDSMRETPSVSSEPLDVLVVDDDDDTLHATALMVSSFGYRCRLARSAEAALSEYERRPAALIVTDWQMSGMNGVDLCRLLKRRSPYTYAVLVTAFPEASAELGGDVEGIDDFLTKPIDVEQMMTRLDIAEQLIRVIRLLDVVNVASRPPGGP
jgi:CheY-like chemotaxis protein